MQIEAYKDPVSGKIFESQQELTDYQAALAVEHQSAARAAVIQARLLELRAETVPSLTSPSELAGKVLAVYTEVPALLDELADLHEIRRTKAERKTKVEVLKVRATRFRFKPDDYNAKQPHQLYLHFYLKVVFSREAYFRLFCAEMQNLDFRTVFTGIQHSGGGSCHIDEATNQYHMDYEVRIPLDKMPGMRASVEALVKLDESKTDHERVTNSAQKKAREESVELGMARTKLQAAQAEVTRAIELRSAAEDLMTSVETSLNDAVSASLPFTQEAELNQALTAFSADADDKFNWSHIGLYLK